MTDKSEKLPCVCNACGEERSSIFLALINGPNDSRFFLCSICWTSALQLLAVQKNKSVTTLVRAYDRARKPDDMFGHRCLTESDQQ